MRDPVADVLAERAAGGRGIGAAVALSLLLHGAGGAFAVYTALRQPPPIAVPQLNIRLAPVQAAASPAKPAAPRIQEPRPQPVTPPPQKAAEPANRNTAPPSPFGRSTKKAAEPVAPPPPPAPASVASTSTGAGGAAGTIGVGEAGITGLEGGDFPYTLYLDNMKRFIGARWLRPEAGGDRGTVVYFRIERDGSIRDARTTTPSGNNSFDRAALRAVLETSSLPPLPFGYSGNYLGVHLTFR